MLRTIVLAAVRPAVQLSQIQKVHKRGHIPCSSLPVYIPYFLQVLSLVYFLTHFMSMTPNKNQQINCSAVYILVLGS